MKLVFYLHWSKQQWFNWYRWPWWAVLSIPNVQIFSFSTGIALEKAPLLKIMFIFFFLQFWNNYGWTQCLRVSKMLIDTAKGDLTAKTPLECHINCSIFFGIFFFISIRDFYRLLFVYACDIGINLWWCGPNGLSSGNAVRTVCKPSTVSKPFSSCTPLHRSRFCCWFHRT